MSHPLVYFDKDNLYRFLSRYLDNRAHYVPRMSPQSILLFGSSDWLTCFRHFNWWYSGINCWFLPLNRALFSMAVLYHCNVSSNSCLARCHDNLPITKISSKISYLIATNDRLCKLLATLSFMMHLLKFLLKKVVFQVSCKTKCVLEKKYGNEIYFPLQKKQVSLNFEHSVSYCNPC